MPTYDYRCETNGRTVEVSHRMSEQLHTWGELCERAHVPCGDTPAEAPVQRMATGGNLVTSLGSGAGPAPSCGAGNCCSGGFCGVH